MNKKMLCEDLMNKGFENSNFCDFVKTFDNISLYLKVYSNLFGKITTLGIIYKFENILEEKYHDEVWDKCIELIDKNDQYLKIGSLGFEFIETDILNREYLNNIDSNLIEYYCEFFAKQIKPLLKKYNI